MSNNHFSLFTFRSSLKKYPFSVACITLIWILSFVPFFPETPLDDVQFIDKWTHLVMYGGTCSVIWIEYLRRHTSLNKKKLFYWAWLAPIIMMTRMNMVMSCLCIGGRPLGGGGSSSTAIFG